MLVLDSTKLSAKKRSVIVDAYDQLARTEIKPIPEMGKDDVRTAFDAAVSAALGLPDLVELRKALGREPMVCLEKL
jgi:hypothetical protein